MPRILSTILRRTHPAADSFVGRDHGDGYLVSRESWDGMLDSLRPGEFLNTTAIEACIHSFARDPQKVVLVDSANLNPSWTASTAVRMNLTKDAQQLLVARSLTEHWTLFEARLEQMEIRQYDSIMKKSTSQRLSELPDDHSARRIFGWLRHHRPELQDAFSAWKFTSKVLSLSRPTRGGCADLIPAELSSPRNGLRLRCCSPEGGAGSPSPARPTCWDNDIKQRFPIPSRCCQKADCSGSLFSRRGP